MEIKNELFSLQDEKYRVFMSRLLPTVDPDTVIGVRTPALQKYAGELLKKEEGSVFLQDLPHRYFEENQLHAFMVSGIRDYRTCMEALCRFLPYVDNWATCDQMSPKVFRKHKQELREKIQEWIGTGRTYTVRFAVGMLMQHFLDEDFDPAYPEMVAGIRSWILYTDQVTHHALFT